MAVIESLLFSAREPLSSAKLAQLAGTGDGRKVRSLVQELQRRYDADGRAFQIEEIGGGFQMLTRPAYSQWVSNLRNEEAEQTLSQAALETLAIVAYRQPILRADLEDIRGVQSDHILRSLLDKKLIRVVGRSEELGRPLLYGTTRRFLEHFGLRSLDELPPVKEFVRKQKEALSPQAEQETPEDQADEQASP